VLPIFSASVLPVFSASVLPVFSTSVLPVFSASVLPVGPILSGYLSLFMSSRFNRFSLLPSFFLFFQHFPFYYFILQIASAYFLFSRGVGREGRNDLPT
jgi:hypothetical protein